MATPSHFQIINKNHNFSNKIRAHHSNGKRIEIDLKCGVHTIFSLFFYTYFYTNSVDVFKKFDAKVISNVNVHEIVILILFS